jgi:hypothetical protein
MVDEEALADLGAGVDLDAGEGTANVGNDPGRHTLAPFIQEMSQAVELASMKAGVGQNNLKCAGSGWVPLLRGFDIAFNAS